MKVVIAGGTGQIGAILKRAFKARGDDVVVLSRTAVSAERVVVWDGRSLGPWVQEVDGCDVVINLAGRSVNCRYTAANLKAMMDSRVESAQVVGAAIAQAKRPPSVWLQMSTATIYAHRFDAANDERSGLIGGDEAGVPSYWGYSVQIAKNWEAAQAAATTPATRQVALRAAMVMSPDKDGIFDVLWGLARRGLGGAVAGGKQYVSWIHGEDFARAVQFIIDHPTLTGAINLAAPNPVPQRELMQGLRRAGRIPIGLPATAWMAELGAVILRTDTELLLKSRRVVPGRLLEAGYSFAFPRWDEAVADLMAKARSTASI